MQTDRHGNISEQKHNTKGSRKETKVKECIHRDTAMCNMKCVIIRVIIGANGIVTKGLKKNLEVIPGKHSTDSLQHTATLVTSCIIQKVLQSET
jgi:hypothetical protein